MKEQLYKKVYIRSAEDLPKETGTYEAFNKIPLPAGVCQMHLFINDKEKIDGYKDYWLKNILWYLQPIEPINKERVIEAMEHIFANVKRIHGNSEALDWIKIAIHRSAEYISYELCDAGQSNRTACESCGHQNEEICNTCDGIRVIDHK